MQPLPVEVGWPGARHNFDVVVLCLHVTPASLWHRDFPEFYKQFATECQFYKLHDKTLGLFRRVFGLVGVYVKLLGRSIFPGHFLEWVVVQSLRISKAIMQLHFCNPNNGLIFKLLSVIDH